MAEQSLDDGGYDEAHLLCVGIAYVEAATCYQRYFCVGFLVIHVTRKPMGEHIVAEVSGVARNLSRCEAELANDVGLDGHVVGDKTFVVG